MMPQSSQIPPQYRNRNAGWSPAKRGVIAAIASLALVAAILAAVGSALFVWPGWLASPEPQETPPPLTSDPCTLAGAGSIRSFVPRPEVHVEPMRGGLGGCTVETRGTSAPWATASIGVTRLGPTVYHSAADQARELFDAACERQRNGEPLEGHVKVARPEGVPSIGDDLCVAVTVDRGSPRFVRVNLQVLQGPDTVGISYMQREGDPQTTTTKVGSFAQLLLAKLK
jgi:hypothetical protein